MLYLISKSLLLFTVNSNKREICILIYTIYCNQTKNKNQTINIPTKCISIKILLGNKFFNHSHLTHQTHRPSPPVHKLYMLNTSRLSQASSSSPQAQCHKPTTVRHFTRVPIPKHPFHHRAEQYQKH